MRFGRKRPEAATPPPQYPGLSVAIDAKVAVAAMDSACGAVAPAGSSIEAAAGLSMAGVRAATLRVDSSIVAMQNALAGAVGKRLPLVLDLAARGTAKQGVGLDAAHDGYHAVDGTGCFQLFAKNVQEVADLNLVARRVAELALNPGVVAHDDRLGGPTVESVRLPEPELVAAMLGGAADSIDSPTPAQRLVFGERRRRIPELFDVDYPMSLGGFQAPAAYRSGVAAQGPYWFDHLQALADQAFDELARLSGRRYARISGHRVEDAEYLLVGQGSLVWAAEAVADHLRETRGLKLGVVNLTMLRPFPSDLLATLLTGRKAVTVLERVDQPLDADPPLLREIRAVLGKAVENGRSRGATGHRGIAGCRADQVPELFSGLVGSGSDVPSAGHLVSAIDNMLPQGDRHRQFHLGVDFLRPGTRLPKLQLWQEQLTNAYPHLAELALPAADVSLRPKDSLAIRIHALGGSGSVELSAALAQVAHDVLGLEVRSGPPAIPERYGQPTVHRLTVAAEPVRLPVDAPDADLVLARGPDPFRTSDLLAGLRHGGVLIVESGLESSAFWNGLPAASQHAIRERELVVRLIDVGPEMSDQRAAAASIGAILQVAPLPIAKPDGRAALLPRIAEAVAARLGPDVGEALERGFAGVRSVDYASLTDKQPERGALPTLPPAMDSPTAGEGVGNPGRFFEQVGFVHQTGVDGIADPFAAFSAMPAATSALRATTSTRATVPELVADRCTGCGQCWVQCPDSAIPAVVSSVDQLLEAAIASSSKGGSLDRLRSVLRPLARETARLLGGPTRTVIEAFDLAYQSVVDRLGLDPERRAATDRELALVRAALIDFPVVKTATFFGGSETSGGLLSLAIDPAACKGCDLCVEVCPERAWVPVAQDDAVLERLERHWDLRERLPDTDGRFVELAAADPGLGPAAALLLRKSSYRSIQGGDGACAGCGEKTALHLVLAAAHAAIAPRVERHVARLDELIAGLDRKAREQLAGEADLDRLDRVDPTHASVPLPKESRERIDRLAAMIRDLKDLRWRYAEGPSGRGRAALGVANATGCSAEWGGTYPYNPYPFPWIHPLDAPATALGVFDAQMRKMADGFVAVRRAELELEGGYDPGEHEPFFASFDWRQFSDEELALCPPIFVVGGDGAMADAHLRSLSQLLGSGRPIRVVVLDNQAHARVGEASSTAFVGSGRKELALLVMAHRAAFLLQSSQAHPTHLVRGVLDGLASRHPAVFAIHAPCLPAHGVESDGAYRAAKLAVESRAFPLLRYDPAAGGSLAERLDLEGNPDLDEAWTTRELRGRDEGDQERSVALPLTVADWAATEGRFDSHFEPLDGTTAELESLPLYDYLAREASERDGVVPFVQAVRGNGRMTRLRVSPEMVSLVEERQDFWRLLRELAGRAVADPVRARMVSGLEREHDRALAELRADYDRRLLEARQQYPRLIARRLAEGLLRANTDRTVAEILAEIPTAPALGLDAPAVDEGVASAPIAEATPAPSPAPAPPPEPAVESTSPTKPVAPADEGADLALEAYIDSVRCTSCDECIGINRKIFAYNEQKQAYIKDPGAGPFRDLVRAAEQCPVGIIHPGTPLDPNEKGLDKLVKRAAAFN